MLSVEPNLVHLGRCLMRIFFKNKGELKRVTRYLDHQRDNRHMIKLLEEYGTKGVQALSEVTPVDTGETAMSWSYSVNKTDKGYTLSWSNSKLAGSVPLVILLQYGHGTTGGTFVQGRDFINPGLRPVVEKLSIEIWKEVLHG